MTPVGTRSRFVSDAVEEAFDVVGYKAQHLKISDLIEKAAARYGIDVEQSRTRRERLMKLGTELRTRSRDGAIAALLGVKALRSIDNADTSIPRAHVLRSLKHEDEIQLLRHVYGSRFLLIGATAPQSVRREQLARIFREDDHLEATEAASEATRLIGVDEREPETEFGQQVGKAFPLADAFLWVPQDGSGVKEGVTRVLKLLFGHPFETPTSHEMAMFHADAARLRSAALGRQVGCAIVDDAGELIVTGTNEVATAGGGQYWTGDRPDGRDFVFGRESSDRFNEQLLRELVVRLQKAGWLDEAHSHRTPEELVAEAIREGGPAGDARVLDVLEFGRTTHAEMAALMTAARRGVSVRGATLFTTTFPCHECARLIVASGIARVIYRDPYPKSKVVDLYSDSMTVDHHDSSHKVPFENFSGVAPRLFPRVFEAMERKDRATGAVVRWHPTEARPRLAGYEEETGAWVAQKEEDAEGRLQGYLESLPA